MEDTKNINDSLNEIKILKPKAVRLCPSSKKSGKNSLSSSTSTVNSETSINQFNVEETKIDLENISLDFNRIVDDLNLYNEKAFIYFFNYLPIIESNIKDLLTLDLSEIFTFYHGDALIYPKDLDWLIVYGLEDEWFYTKK